MQGSQRSTPGLQWLRQQLQLLAPSGASEASAWVDTMWQPELHAPVASAFLHSSEAAQLFGFVAMNASQAAALVLTADVGKARGTTLYFSKRAGAFNNTTNLQARCFRVLADLSPYQQPQNSLLRLMSAIYRPAAMAGQLQRFMAALTETVHTAHNRTVLYVPEETLPAHNAAVRDKDLVQRLEGVLMQWTRRVREVAAHQDAGVTAVVAVLELARSAHLPPFQALHDMVEREAAVAADNLRLLAPLEAPCQALAAAPPRAAVGMLPGILGHVRLLWTHSGFYGNPDRITGLLRKVSDEVINRCCAVISLPAVFAGACANGVMEALQDSIEACSRWGALYQRCVRAIGAATPKQPWSFDAAPIFAHVDAFVQRCRDLQEVCESQHQFAPVVMIPSFGGSRGPEVMKSIADIQAGFGKLVTRLQLVGYNILDVRNTAWYDDFSAFRSGVRGLEVRLSNVMQLAVDSAGSLSAHTELLEAFQTMSHSRGLIRRIEATWSVLQAVAPGLPQGLSSPLLTQEKSGGLLAAVFDRALLHLSEESEMWEQMRLHLPPPAIELRAQRDRLRVLRISVAAIVRGYNQLLGGLEKDARRLFHDRIRQLDRSILPATHTLTWASPKHALDFYFREANLQLKKIDAAVAHFIAGNKQIEVLCRTISETLLLSVARKRIYSNAEFTDEQAQHRDLMQARLERAHAGIVEVLQHLYTFFASDSDEVHREWARFTVKVDRRVEDALRGAVRRSLAELARLLAGDKRAEIAPLFTVALALERTNRIELRPTVQELFNMVHAASQEIVALTGHLPRLAQRHNPSTKHADQAAARDLPQPPSFQDVIAADEEAVLRPIAAITVGVTGIVDKVQTLLMYWEKKYKSVWDQDKDAYMRRYEKAQKPLAAFESDITRYADLAEEIIAENTGEAVRFLFVDCGPLKQTLNGHCEAWSSKFSGLLQTKAARELAELHSHFQTSNAALKRVPADLSQLSEDIALHKSLAVELPLLHARFEPLRDNYRALAKFEVPIPELEAVQLEALEEALRSVQIALTAAAAAARIGGTLQSLALEIQGWPALEWIQERVDGFASTMPLIANLRSPALRPRHWHELENRIDAHADPDDAHFNLEAVLGLRLDQHAPFVSTLAATATKELGIETALEGVAKTWSALGLNFTEHKGIYKVRSADEVFAALEDSSVALSAMKASRFTDFFADDITGWERTLASMSQTLEAVLQVQASWTYLESIFGGSEDIRRQLPTDSALFDSVRNAFKDAMAGFHASRASVVQACMQDGLLGSLTAMAADLERVQGALEGYLDVKRSVFPRFHFLAADDLLEVLGPAKDPHSVQPHLKKFFEGIKQLEIHAPGSDGRRTHEATGAFASDGEYLPFLAPVAAEGPPELWLARVEAAMYASVKKLLVKAVEEAKAARKDIWVKAHQGQLLIAAGQVSWAGECEKALGDPVGARTALSSVRKRWDALLARLTTITRSNVSDLERNKVVALITIEVHARDVVERLHHVSAHGVDDFEWTRQLRFYWSRELNECVARQVSSVFTYGYEYQGNNGRLVITPLTDRCYMMLGSALCCGRAGTPLGPAGTGKTETIKDFGKALARYVTVFNCSDGVDVKTSGRILSGLAQTGAWACMEELSCIPADVLSVVATQIAALMQAVEERKSHFNFTGRDTKLVLTCGVFATMKVGRSELPDNLKALLRPISMMAPDCSLIAEVMLFSDGFLTAKELARKIAGFLQLLQQSLSKRDHYDFGLRSCLIPIIHAAGVLRRREAGTMEAALVHRTMVDLIQPKLVHADIPIFAAVLADLFPEVQMQAVPATPLRAAIEAELLEAGLQVVPAFVTKIVQIYDCKLVRHANMLVGRSGSGKTTAWQCLQRALTRLHREHTTSEVFQKVADFVINPIALSYAELYGGRNAATGQWHDGVLAHILRSACRDESPDQKWLVLDAPVDARWVESMNTLLDRSRVLTLLSGERLALPSQVSILFEPGQDGKDQGWSALVELWWQFSLTWGIGGILTDDGRKAFDGFMRELVPRLPTPGTIFDYCIDVEKLAWQPWEARLPAAFRVPQQTPLHRVVVPTVDTLRVRHVAAALIAAGAHVLLVGPTGIGKSVVAGALMEELPVYWASLTIRAGALTTSSSLQAALEAGFEKRTKGVLAPSGGRRVVAFVDDLHMPAPAAHARMPPLELLKLWADHGFWYDRRKCEAMHVKDMQLVASATPEQSGQPVTQRLRAYFTSVGMTAPDDLQLRRIFTALVNAKLADFDDAVKPMVEPLGVATVELLRVMKSTLLPRPGKEHYRYGMRDLLKMVKGLQLASKLFHDNQEAMLQLWVHEAQRLVTDMDVLKEFLDKRLEAYGAENGNAPLDTQPGGHALLVGHTGSGRRSLARLAAYVAGQTCISIEVTQGYRPEEFRSDLKKTIRQAGTEGKAVAFLLDDTQMIDDAFLEDINSMLITGEVQGMFLPEEVAMLTDSQPLTAAATARRSMLAAPTTKFWDRVHANLHFILTMSPASQAFRERCRMYPGLVTCAAVDWFTEWPATALHEVALRTLADAAAGDLASKGAICQAFVAAHAAVADASKRMLVQLRRPNHITPAVFLEAIRNYRSLLAERQHGVSGQLGKLRGGLAKLAEARAAVKQLAAATSVALMSVNAG
ncbi:hypothetical protein WJX81_008333 [Elliptochloris bilobata]|uniref:Dynein heavy chain, cytoplasmic n=1 Tax=Elliptochloris bilobata TaxID=381761 RepID=A0AAW1SLA3_9CHLO